MLQKYNYDHPFTTESGDTLPSLTIGYHTFGRLNADRSNVIWVCHALTANSDVADWWPNTVEAGKFLDPERYFIVCANVLGSCYGTTGPLSVNPATDEPWYETFPKVTIRDIVSVHRLLADHLGISRVKLLIGSSLGGFQTMEWAIMDPGFAENIALIATSSYSRPWASAFNEAQRMAIDADRSYGEHRPDAGAAGLATARAIAMLSYRGGIAYDATQQDADPENTFFRRVHSYQRHQGNKLADRFNAFSYYRISQAVDSHNVGRGRGGREKALASIKANTLIVAITSDILFPPADHQDMVDAIPSVEFRVIDSSFGHDGFLIEHEALDRIISRFLR